MNLPIFTAINGGVFNLSELDMASISPEQVAHSLSHINRFTGHAGAYSVAQHCVLVAELLPPHLKLAGLLHDAHESVIGDISTPVKNLIGSERLGHIDNALLDSLDRLYCVDTRHELVHEADMTLLSAEASRFGLDIETPLSSRFDEPMIERWSPNKAEVRWLALFYALTGVAR